jgi:hypothetical protein
MDEPNKIPRTYQIHNEVVTDQATAKNLLQTIEITSPLSDKFIIPVEPTRTLLKTFIISEARESNLAKKIGNLGDPTVIPAGIAEAEQATSMLGLSIWDSITLLDPVQSGNINKAGASMDIALVTVNQQRNIITTAVAGLDGTIKEYISDGDFYINISATLVGAEADVYPADAVQSLLAVFKAKNPINIYSTVLNKYFNISSVVVTNYTFAQPEQGMRNVQQLDFTCISDNPNLYTLILQTQS